MLELIAASTPSTHTVSPMARSCAVAVVRDTTPPLNALLTTVVPATSAAVQKASCSVSPKKATAVVMLCLNVS